jgi:hypothetical protein
MTVWNIIMQMNRTYLPNKDVIKNPLGHVNSKETKEYQIITCGQTTVERSGSQVKAITWGLHTFFY